jgi:hypothetical protein
VKSTCMVAYGETHSPLQQIDIQNNPDMLVSSCGDPDYFWQEMREEIQ